MTIGVPHLRHDVPSGELRQAVQRPAVPSLETNRELVAALCIGLIAVSMASETGTFLLLAAVAFIAGL